MPPRISLVTLSALEVAANEENYNSSFHNPSEAPNLPSQLPSELPTEFGKHLQQIMESQNIPPSSLQKIFFTPSQCRLILQSAQASLQTRVFNRVYLSDLLEDLSPIFSTLIFPPAGLFLRLNACSPKDGEGGTQPLRTLEDIFVRLTTSYRACNPIQSFLNKQGEDKKMLELFFLPFDSSMDTSLEYRVFCAPSQDSYWSPRAPGSGLYELSSALESHLLPQANAFPQPPQISAISQYRWHKASSLSSLLPTTSPEFQDTIRVIVDEALRIHGLIISAALGRMRATQQLNAEKCSVGDGNQLTTELSMNAVGSSSNLMDRTRIIGNVEQQDMDNLLFEQGFVFDMRYIPSTNLVDGEKKADNPRAMKELESEGRCELIELNTFGTLSACGACLFHWVRDGNVLYNLTDHGGLEKGKGEESVQEIEFRISL